ncbi:histidine phosphatase family protein [Ectobacillus funiculus]|uniref:histidine phosphatase family protein n=1 Tax=Ectobacillus funiculus TaxID=137993 RepID=UPI00397B5050
MKIIFARHGETDENAARCYLGHFDARLNETGRQQIHRLAEHVRQMYGKDITRIYCSDLSRTRESAEIIGSYLQLQPVSIHALRELHFGDWECETYDSIRERELLTEWIQNPFQIAPPHGETLQQLGNRVDTWLSHILLHEKEDETILVMSHGGPIRWVLAKWILGDRQEFWNAEGVKHGSGLVIKLGRDGNLCAIIDRMTWNE